MNIFYIPSWFPSSDHPLHGIFIYDQIDGITRNYSNVNAGVSVWGQKDEHTLLFCKKPFSSLQKLSNYRDLKETTFKIKPNWITYHNPTFTWTKRIMGGNINNIIVANECNYMAFERNFGKVDLIHAFITFPGGFIASELAKKHNLPYIITEEMSPFRPDIFMNREGKIEQEVISPLRNASKVIAVSPYSAKQIENFINSPVISIPNMVDEKSFSHRVTCEKIRKFIFFTLGRMVEQKGITVLLEAISKLRDMDIVFRIGGDGEDLKKYKALGERLKLNNIEWLGELNRNQARAEFENCNAFVLASLHESMGVVFAEAIACGKPIIATKCGGPESIVNEKNGLLAEVGDGQDLADKIDWMVENYNTFDSKVIREDFLQRFSSSVVSEQIIDIYKKVIEENRQL